MIKHEKGHRAAMSDKIVNTAEKEALKAARQNGLKIGTVVGLAGDDYSYELKAINGNQAIIGYENKEHGKVEKTVPFDSLLDVNAARDIAFKMRFQTGKTFPPEMLN